MAHSKDDALVFVRKTVEERAPLAAELGQLYDIWRLMEGPRHEREAEIRSFCRTAYLGHDTSLCRVLGRYKMYVDTQDIGISSHLMLDGFWEMWVTEAMMRVVRPGMTALDIGANLGFYTLLLADLVGPSGRVLAFEPNPAIADRLRRSVAVNGFASTTDVHAVALGTATGEIAMELVREQPGGGRVVEITDDNRATVVPVRRLDDIPGAMDADFIKLDVEGAERLVWDGMGGLLARARPLTLFIEFTIGRHADARGFLDQMLGHGFSLGIIDFTQGVQPITPDALFQTNHAVDHMLALTR